MMVTRGLSLPFRSTLPRGLDKVINGCPRRGLGGGGGRAGNLDGTYLRYLLQYSTILGAPVRATGHPDDKHTYVDQPCA